MQLVRMCLLYQPVFSDKWHKMIQNVQLVDLENQKPGVCLDTGMHDEAAYHHSDASTAVKQFLHICPHGVSHGLQTQRQTGADRSESRRGRIS